MSLPLDELYREIILDHYKQPRNRGELDPHSARVEGNNPLCGDEIQLDVRLNDGQLEDLAFQGRGCSISQASASMMTEAVKAKPLDDVHQLIDIFKDMMRGQPVDTEELGDLEALEGVQKFPVRIKCALLAWTTLEEALKEANRSTT
ncbi:MAG TPA: SUF system NifU family Fe-S cluster assembly protein [Chloroflexota bacterium]|nr:SUF system NifU family Fe-S cluster assembly protein [Chloroflexota bacterium]